METSPTDTAVELQRLRSEVSSLRETIDSFGGFVFVKDFEGRYVYANRTIRELFRLELVDIIGKRDEEFFDQDFSDDLWKHDAAVLQHGEIIESEEYSSITGSGEQRIYWTVKRPIYDEAGEIVGLSGISSDITNWRRLEQEAERNRTLLKTVLSNVGAAIYMKDSDRRFIYVNQKTCEILGMRYDEVVGKRDSELMPSEEAKRFEELDQVVLDSGERQVAEETFPDQTGRLRRYLSTKVPIKDDNGSVSSYIGFSHDITEFLELKEKFQRLATTDELTGIANRRHFIEIAERDFAAARRELRPIALIIFDIDHFKLVNDEWGHAVGDRVLVDVARTCAESVRQSDFMGRIGGEEFAVVLPNTSLEEATSLAERLRIRVEELTCETDRGIAIDPRISLGVAQAEASTADFNETMRCADDRLYEAKRSGRNTVR